MTHYVGDEYIITSLLHIITVVIFACYCMLLQNRLLQCYYIFLHCYYLLLHLSLLPIITNSLLLIITSFYVIFTSLLPHYAILKIHVIMDSLLHIITLACFIITHYYPLCHYFPLLPIINGATCRCSCNI